VATFRETPIVWVATEKRGHVVFVPEVERLDKPMFDWLGKSDLTGKMTRWGAAGKLRSGSGGSRNLWLIALSLLVCIVGITNAMLMSVTERFREIGTMKCLGALDVFIVKLFLIESTLMGVVGTLIGIALGLGLSVVRAAFSFSIEDPATQQTVYLGLKYLPVGAIMIRVLAAFVVGVALSILAAIYPALTAARMEPVEAMRVEE
jgi:predicted lysophospholipase L1 biosynthesis ABC-type transport system permease subunit